MSDHGQEAHGLIYGAPRGVGGGGNSPCGRSARHRRTRIRPIGSSAHGCVGAWCRSATIAPARRASDRTDRPWPRRLGSPPWRRSVDGDRAGSGRSRVYAAPARAGYRRPVRPGNRRHAGIPLVLRRADPHGGADAEGEVVAHTETGRFSLPADACAVLGADHPTATRSRPTSWRCAVIPTRGDLVISGWRPDGRSLSFPFEHGAHAGPGPGGDRRPSRSSRPTRRSYLPPTRSPPNLSGSLRPRDLRRAGFAVLDGARAGGRPHAHPPRSAGPDLQRAFVCRPRRSAVTRTDRPGHRPPPARRRGPAGA